MSSPWFVTLLCWMLVALPVETKAQEAARSLAELMGAKGTFVGEDVYITRATGRPISGAIADLSPDALSVTSGAQTWRLRDADILRIERGDSLENGVGLGLLLGIGAVLMTGITCKATQQNTEQCAYVVAYSTIPTVVVGGVVGAVVDAKIRQTLYVAGMPGSARLGVRPMLSRNSMGAAVALGW